MTNISKLFIAATTAVGLSGCVSTQYPSVNTPANTTYTQANKNPIAVSRCEENGILVSQANGYNAQQFRNANRQFFASGGVSSERVDTRNGSFLLYYKTAVTQSNANLGSAAGAIAGGAAGAQIGGGSGRVAAGVFGAIIGSAVGSAVQDMLPKGSNNLVRAIDECRKDLYEIHGGANAGASTPRETDYDNGRYERRRGEPTRYTPYTLPYQRYDR